MRYEHNGISSLYLNWKPQRKLYFPFLFFNLVCVHENSQGACEKCQVSKQCKEGMTCCPTKKVCVKNSCSECEGSPSAQCRPACLDHMVHSQYTPCTCANTQFPDYWAPQCGSKNISDMKKRRITIKKFPG